MKIYISNKTAFHDPLQSILSNKDKCYGNKTQKVDEWDNAQFIWKNVARGLVLENLPKLEILNIFMTSHQTLTDKSSLYKTGTNTMRDFFSVAPTTWLSTVPPIEDGIYISKPSGSFCGNGIRIHRSPIYRSDFKSLHVIQTYIEKPLLYHGHKFDVRMFVLLGLDRMMYYCDGSIKYSTELYDPPVLKPGETLLQEAIKTKHLTNAMQGNQSATLDKLADVGMNPTVLYDFIKTLKPLFQHAQAVENRYRRENHIVFESFELLGLDIIFDEDKRPWLLEINKDPSIKPGGILDDLMNNLLEDVLKEAVWFRMDPSKKTPTGFIEF